MVLQDFHKFVLAIFIYEGHNPFFNARSGQEFVIYFNFCVDQGSPEAVNVVFFAFHFGVILFGVILSFSPGNNPMIVLPYWIAAQYLQSLFFWSEHRYLMPFYPFLILIALSWYWNFWQQRQAGSRNSVSHRTASSE